MLGNLGRPSLQGAAGICVLSFQKILDIYIADVSRKHTESRQWTLKLRIVRF